MREEGGGVKEKEEEDIELRATSKIGQSLSEVKLNLKKGGNQNKSFHRQERLGYL